MPSAGRIKAIWACANEHKIDRAGVHDAIWAWWKKTSVKDLTDREADQLLDGMRGKRQQDAGGLTWERREAMNFHGRKKDTARDLDFLINDTEKRLLWQAACELGMNEEGFERFCRRQIGKAQASTMREYNKVFWGLKAMQRRDRARRGGSNVA